MRLWGKSFSGRNTASAKKKKKNHWRKKKSLRLRCALSVQEIAKRLKWLYQRIRKSVKRWCPWSERRQMMHGLGTLRTLAFALSEMGFPGDSDGKESACNVGDPDLISGSKRSPGEGSGNPLQYSCLENPVDRGAWQTTVCGVTKSQTWPKWEHAGMHARLHAGSPEEVQEATRDSAAVSDSLAGL